MLTAHTSPGLKARSRSGSKAEPVAAAGNGDSDRTEQPAYDRFIAQLLTNHTLGPLDLGGGLPASPRPEVPTAAAPDNSPDLLSAPRPFLQPRPGAGAEAAASSGLEFGSATALASWLIEKAYVPPFTRTDHSPATAAAAHSEGVAVQTTLDNDCGPLSPASSQLSLGPASSQTTRPVTFVMPGGKKVSMMDAQLEVSEWSATSSGKDEEGAWQEVLIKGRIRMSSSSSTWSLVGLETMSGVAAVSFTSS